MPTYWAPPRALAHNTWGYCIVIVLFPIILYLIIKLTPAPFQSFYDHCVVTSEDTSQTF